MGEVAKVGAVSRNSTDLAESPRIRQRQAVKLQPVKSKQAEENATIVQLHPRTSLQQAYDNSKATIMKPRAILHTLVLHELRNRHSTLPNANLPKKSLLL